MNPCMQRHLIALLLLLRWSCGLQPQKMAPLVSQFPASILPQAVKIRSFSPSLPEYADDVVFLGTGGSSGTPHLHCLLSTREGATGEPCAVCLAAIEGDPKTNPNYRGNPSILIRHRTAAGGVATVLVDAGKTFRESAQRWFPPFASGGVDAVLLTHEHADAVLGLDDLRAVQRARPLPVFAARQCLDRVAQVFPYLQPAARVGRDPRLFVAALDWRELPGLALSHDPAAPPALPCVFEPVPGLLVEAFPVEHGPGFMSLGFAFGPDGAKFVYISDVSAVPPGTLTRLRQFDIATLVVDCLDPGKTAYPSHFSLPQALALARTLRPARTLLVGMSHRFEHHAANAELAEIGDLHVRLAHDGLCVSI
jgi:phosphoribosyl 1,2-cyclic phosphodiesterase